MPNKPACPCSCHWPENQPFVVLHFMPCCGDEEMDEERPPTDAEAKQFQNVAHERMSHAK